MESQVWGLHLCPEGETEAYHMHHGAMQAWSSNWGTVWVVREGYDRVRISLCRMNSIDTSSDLIIQDSPMRRAHLSK
jgi:hypothetical protein